jgi:hypothetical protein
MLDPAGGKFDKYADDYLRCRDKIDEIKEKHKKELEPYNQLMEKIKGWLTEHLNQIGVQNVKTVHGTVHFTKRRTVTLTDAQAFMEYVIKYEEWDLLDRKANSTAVQEFIKDHGSEPPGARLNTFTDVSVNRRAASGKED